MKKPSVSGVANRFRNDFRRHPSAKISKGEPRWRLRPRRRQLRWSAANRDGIPQNRLLSLKCSFIALDASFLRCFPTPARAFGFADLNAAATKTLRNGIPACALTAAHARNSRR